MCCYCVLLCVLLCVIRAEVGTGQSSTFVDDRHFEGYADDAHQVFSGHKGAQDGTDSQGFPFTLVDQLKEEEEGEKVISPIEISLVEN